MKSLKWGRKQHQHQHQHQQNIPPRPKDLRASSSGFSFSQAFLPRRWISKLKQSLVPKTSAQQHQQHTNTKQKEMPSMPSNSCNKPGVSVTTLSDHLSFTPKSLGHYITCNEQQPPRHSYCGGDEEGILRDNKSRSYRYHRKRDGGRTNESIGSESDYFSISLSKKECRAGGLLRSRSERVNSVAGSSDIRIRGSRESLHVPELKPIQTARKDEDPIRKKIRRKKRIKVNSPRLAPLNNNKKKIKKKKKMEEESAGRTKNLESFAVVKNSMDPQEDFRNSMIEMILENKMARREEFESLLDCYLALNADEYHDVIVKAFRQVWFVLNPHAPTTSSSSSSSL